MSDYPEHEKLAAVKDESQAQGEFLSWLTSEKGVHLFVFDGDSPRSLMCSAEDLLAEYHGVDLKALEREKRAMLEQMRRASSEEQGDHE